MPRTNIQQEFYQAIVSVSASTSSTVFVTPGSSPALSVTPKTSGLWKVSISLPLDMSPNDSSFLRVINTSGGATLVSFNNGIEFGTPGGSICSPTAHAVYRLTAGVTYIFDYQIAVSGGALVTVPNDPRSQAALTAERI